MQTWAYINGKYYDANGPQNQWLFTAQCNFTGKAASDGSGANSIVTAGSSYTFLYYNPGASYPYAIGIHGGGWTVRCWVRASVFPLATYTVSYNANGGSGAPGNQTKTYGYNLTLSSTRPSRTGYTFKGWATSASGGTSYAPGGTYTSNGGATLYAVWARNTYTVNYYGNGATSGSGPSDKVLYGDNYTTRSNMFGRTGYTFKGWNEASNGSGTDWTGNIGKPWKWTYTKGVNLYAQWRINTYTVSYNANGGNGAPNSQTKTYGQDMWLSSTKPYRTGYTFKGWAMTSGGNVAYTAGAKFTHNGSVTLYAVWTVNTYSVTYKPNGAPGEEYKETATYNSDYTTWANWYSRRGHTFVGWNERSDGNGVDWTGNIGKPWKWTYTRSVTLYAIWKANTYSVKFDASTNGGTGDKTIQKTYGHKLGTLPKATKKYYVFLGWFTKPVGGIQITENTVVQNDMQVYAQYVIDASVYITTGGKRKPGFPYVYVNGKPKKGYAYVYKNGAWRQGLSE